MQCWDESEHCWESKRNGQLWWNHNDIILCEVRVVIIICLLVEGVQAFLCGTIIFILHFVCTRLPRLMWKDKLMIRTICLLRKIEEYKNTMQNVKIMHKTTSWWSVFFNFWARSCKKSQNFKLLLNYESLVFLDVLRFILKVKALRTNVAAQATSNFYSLFLFTSYFKSYVTCSFFSSFVTFRKK